jgi:hypothetical protein
LDLIPQTGFEIEHKTIKIGALLVKIIKGRKYSNF